MVYVASVLGFFILTLVILSFIRNAQQYRTRAMQTNDVAERRILKNQANMQIRNLFLFLLVLAFAVSFMVFVSG